MKTKNLLKAFLILLVGFVGGLILAVGMDEFLRTFVASLFKDMATWMAVSVAAIAGFIAYRAYLEQVEARKITLWRDLSKEFDHELIMDRHRCGLEYKPVGIGKGNAIPLETSGPIIDFFETVAYLVRNNEIPQKLAKHTFWYSFDAYFRATWFFIRNENAKSIGRSIYEDILWLHGKWGNDKAFDQPREMENYFKTEISRSEQNIKVR